MGSRARRVQGEPTMGWRTPDSSDDHAGSPVHLPHPEQGGRTGVSALQEAAARPTQDVAGTVNVASVR